ncbi:hypothetical protein K5549_022094, partial [Capra hircus]
FFKRENGECIEKYVSGTKEGNFYAVDYAGHNEFQLIRGDENTLLTHTVNVDEHGKETELVQLFGTGNNVESQDKEEYYNAVREKEIPEENIVNFIDTGKGIIPFPLTIPFNWCVKSRKQVNLFKISSSTSNLFKDPILQERKEGRKKENLEMLGNVSNRWLFYFSPFFSPR